MSEKTMKAARFHQHGTPDVLQIEDVEIPAPAAGEVRIRVAASAFNPADNGIRAGFLPIPVSLPHTPGYDVAGTIDALGDDVSAFTEGDAVIGFLPMTAPGAAAEYVIAPASALVSAPTSIPLVDAAAIPSVALTARQALFDEAGLEQGQRVLVVGAGGTVGGFAVQFAKQAGAHVIATASPRSSRSVRDAGADEVIDHTATTVPESIGEPVDLLLNLAPIDPEEFEALVERVRDGGVVVSTTAWMPAPDDASRGVRSVVVYVRSESDQLARIVSLVDSGDVRVEVARRVPLTELAAVHAEATAGTLRGKVVVLPIIA
ncbi:NADP-dependent oxidoreductase [Herbiconiux sp. CPCC 203407]|uniref:NADP-dependent oxidoreductase n=1 Tax=Herbiconiux oxytropis TaxID=2970915 RepID=A0AA41XHT6_9MICO|nr:NADP-dependent oxidoreductase [Herbiconiux oxytropis]MCS5723438.1 NADP-dependent oxidoreductase [Herbiconiux oxytropis]MCS5726525.1 NADP-dependent oxidoreductase [Herbiconiux oxytropis]